MREFRWKRSVRIINWRWRTELEDVWASCLAKGFRLTNVYNIFQLWASHLGPLISSLSIILLTDWPLPIHLNRILLSFFYMDLSIFFFFFWSKWIFRFFNLEIFDETVNFHLLFIYWEVTFIFTKKNNIIFLKRKTVNLSLFKTGWSEHTFWTAK